MLDAFLEVLVEKEARHTQREEMADAFMALPVEELHKIASGGIKLADYDEHEWLSKFKDTPLYEPALQLEQQCLELDIQDQQMRQQERAQQDQIRQGLWDAKDAIRLKKRMLDLELLKMESSATAGGNIAAEQPQAPDMQQQQQAAPQNPQGVAGAPMENVPKQASSPLDEVLKIAAELQAGQREDIKSKNFAVHPKGGDPKYPIHDAAHARNALTRVRQFGTPAEKAQVFAAVTKKYPALATRSEVIPEKLQRKAEHKVGVGRGQESQKKEAPKQKLSCGDVKMASVNLAILNERMQKVALSARSVGALAGTGLGALGGAMTGGAKEPGGQSHRLRNALIGAGLGAGVGYGGGAAVEALRKGAPAAASAAGAAEEAAKTLPSAAAAPAAAQAAEAAAVRPPVQLPKPSAPPMKLQTSELQVVPSQPPPLPARRALPPPSSARVAPTEMGMPAFAEAPAATGRRVPPRPANPRPAPPAPPSTQQLVMGTGDPSGIMGQWVGQPGRTMGMTALASARVIPPDVLAAMRMQKLAAMGPGDAAIVADAWGRQMAYMEKDAIPGVGLVKGLGAKLMPYASKAFGAAKANPALAGAALGAGVGAIGGAAGAGEGHRLSGALKGGLAGGAIGGAAGYAAPRVSSKMQLGYSPGQALKATGQEAWTGAKGLGQRASNWFQAPTPAT